MKKEMAAKVCKGVPSIVDGDSALPREPEAHSLHWISVVSGRFNSWGARKLCMGRRCPCKAAGRI